MTLKATSSVAQPGRVNLDRQSHAVATGQVKPYTPVGRIVGALSDRQALVTIVEHRGNKEIHIERVLVLEVDAAAVLAAQHLLELLVA